MIKGFKNNSTFQKLFAIFVALLVWQIVAMTIHQPILLVTPVAVFMRLLTIWKVEGFCSSIWFTFCHIALGFLFGLLLGIFLAVLSYKSKFIEILLWPWLATIKAVPVASFVVICLIWLSSQNLSIFISFLIVLPTIYQNTLVGLRAMNIQLLEMSDIYRISLKNRIRFIVIPEIASYIHSSCKISCSMAWKAGVAAEIIGTPNGSIGKMLYLSKITLDTDDLLAWTLIIVLISIISEKIFIRGLGYCLGMSKYTNED